MTSILFIGFHFILYLFGRGFALGVTKISKLELKRNLTHIGNIRVDYFYPVLALFVIGNLTVFINFFAPVNNIFVKILFLLFIGINFLDMNFQFDRESILNLGIVPFVLSISSYGINIAQDAGLYHLNVQSWIRDEQIHLGLSNIHSRYGYSSIFDYISSNFWMNDNFLLIHFINLSFIVLFFVFICKNLFLKENVFLKNLSILVIIFGILDNFGVSGGRNGFIDIEAVTKYDTPFAIIYFLTGCLIINNLLNKNFDIFQVTVILFMLLLAVQLRIFGVTLVPLFLILFNKVLKEYRVRNILLAALLPSLLLFFWVIKNILITSCLFFPVEQLCFQNLAWSDITSAQLEAADLRNFHIFYSFDQNFFVWIKSWLSKPINYSLSINYLLSFFSLGMFNFIFYKKSNNKNIKSTQFYVFLCILISYFIWFLSAPGVRFGLGLFLLSLSLLAISNHGSKERFSINNNLKNITLSFLFLISLMLLIRVDTYRSFADNFNQTIQVKPTNISYIENPLGWGVLPATGNDSCWINIECMPKSKRISKVSGVYDYFLILNN